MTMIEPHKFDAEAVAEKTIDLLGGRDKAFALIQAEFEEMRTRWNQDVIAIGRILRSHLYVEHYLTEFLEKTNPRLGSLADARLTFAQKVNLLNLDRRLAQVLPGIKRLNTIRNRLAHRLDAHVTYEDANVFLSDGVFKAMRIEGAKPGTPSSDPLDVLEAFAQYVSSALQHEFSVLGNAFSKAHDIVHLEQAKEGVGPMIEFAGLAYTLAKEAFGNFKVERKAFNADQDVADAAKDINEHFQYKDVAPRLVDFQWPEVSGFIKSAEAAGYRIGWSQPDKVARRELDGYEIMYEIDEKERTRRSLILRDGLVLIGKKL